MLRNLTMFIVSFSIMLTVGLSDGKENTSIRFDQKLQLIEYEDGLLSFVVVPNVNQDAVAVLIIDPRMPPITVTLED